MLHPSALGDTFRRVGSLSKGPEVLATLVGKATLVLVDGVPLYDALDGLTKYKL